MKKNLDIEQVKKCLREQVLATCMKFVEHPNVYVNGAYVDANVVLDFSITTDEEGKAVCEFKFIEKEETNNG